jgi:hypothetical protein
LRNQTAPPFKPDGFRVKKNTKAGQAGFGLPGIRKA